MKKIIRTITTLLIILSISKNTIAQCHIDDWYALSNLYLSTDGDNWMNNTGWQELINNVPPNCNLALLHGVGLDHQGRVDSLNLGGDGLIGSIPAEVGNLSNLRHLTLWNNQLNGSIPSEIGNLSNLAYISLSFNQFNGSIPVELGNLSKLTQLYLRENQLRGSIPVELGNLSKLTNLSLSINQLSGSNPFELANLSKLTNLTLQGNNLSGSILTELGSLGNLNTLNLASNQLGGSIPAELANLTNLTNLAISNNNLSGCYPTNIIVFCTQLIYPDISDGNIFDANWEDFCTTGAGICVPADVYPGDLNYDGIVNNQDVGLSGLNLYETGPPRATKHQNTNWNPYPAEDWNRQQLNNEDIKHFDCNGDGVIMDDDHQAVMDNLGQTWTTPISPPTPPPQSDFKLMLLPAEQLSEGYLLSNLSLERRATGDMDIQGGYFTIDYSEIEGTINFVTLGLYNESWLGNRNDDLFYEIEELPEQQKIEVGFTKTDYVSSTGCGIIGELIISFSTNQSRLAHTSNNMLEIRLTTIGVHNGTELQLLEDEIREVCINCNTCEPNWTINEDTPFQNLYSSNDNIATDGFVLIGANQEVEYKANRTTLNCGFGVRTDADFRVRIGGCD